MDFPTFIMTLLSDNWLFFEDDEIVWDGKRHQIVGIQVNGAQITQFMEFVDSAMEDFDDIRDVVNYFLAFMNELEKDEGLIVPRNSIAPGIRKAIREGDLTGITLANLAACGGAFRVKLQDEDNYVVIYDTRLGTGIPAFYDLIARMLWDLRQCLHSQKGVPFDVVFVSARNFDANEYIDIVPKMVSGVQENPGAMHIAACPKITMNVNSEKKNAAENNQHNYSERAMKTSKEEFKMDALPRIEDALTKRISSDEYISISEAVGFGFMQKRQEACNGAVNSSRSDEDNVTAMCREVARFNPIIARYVEYMLDLLDTQKELGASDEEIAKMADEVEELFSLITDRFSCGNEYLDSIANDRAPIQLPDSFDELHNRINTIKK